MYSLENLDTPSIALVIFMIATILAFGMTMLWRWDHTEQGFGFWVGAQWALSLGMLFLFSRAIVPLPVSVALGNGGLMLMLILMRIGIGRFRERSVEVWPDIAIALLITAAITMNSLVGGYIETRIALVCAAIALLALRCIGSLQGMQGTVRTAARLTQSVLLFIAVMVVIRGFVAAVRDPVSTSLFESGVASATTFLSVAMATVALPFILVVMNSARTKEQLSQAHAAAETASETDALTGLLNRRGLFRAVEELRADRLVGVCLIDLDRFKRVNDSHGHDTGDRVLRELARLMFDAAPGCLHARLGGEEFLMIVPGADRAETLSVAEAVRERVGSELGSRSGLDQSITASIGASAGPRTRFDELLTTADLALYQAKRAGRNRALGAGPGDTSKTPSGRMVRHRGNRQPV